LRQISWGIVGCGSIADKRIAPALLKSSVNRLLAVASRDRSRAEAFAAKHGGVRPYHSYDAMLADPDVQVVYVGTPNAAHRHDVVAACRAGKHVFCEKPMALTMTDCQAMADEARVAGVKLGIGFNNRYNPVHQEMRRRIAAGEIGAVRHATLLFAMNRARQRWRLEADLAGAGCLYDMGVHGIDLMRFLLNDEVTLVTAFLDTSKHGWPLDEAATGLLKFASGTTVDITVSSKIPYPGNAIVLYGEAATLAGIETLVSQIGGFLPPAGRLELTTEAGTLVSTTFEVRDLFQAELDAFGGSIADGREPDISAHDGMRAQEIALAMQRSSSAGVTVHLNSERQLEDSISLP
jgi:1,5-anhydro-D-fructose reductase (1,5-anhydro-D-mannitol-forming)